MLTRVKQLFAALTAKVTAADREYIKKILSPAERGLFYEMDLPDQRHALNTAHTALKLAEARSDVDRELLARCALLHDVGKKRGDISTWDKILAVIAYGFAPGWSLAWGRYGRGSRLANLRHAFYIYSHHAARGAELLAGISEDQRIADIIRRHHAGPERKEKERPELDLLQQADRLN